VDDARDGSWRRCFTVLLYLAAKPRHMVVDVDGLAYPLHYPMAYGNQTRGQGLLPALSYPVVAVGWWCLSWGCEVHGLGYLVSINRGDAYVTESYME
jgi:hypothetical protein